MAENLSEAYVITPPEFALWHELEPVTLDRLRVSMIHWLAGEHLLGARRQEYPRRGEFRRNARRCCSKLVRNASL